MKLERYKRNPILKPVKTHHWEGKAVFNTAAIYLNKKIHLIYRAVKVEDNLLVYYGGADTSIGVASCNLKELVQGLKSGKI